MSPAMKLLRPIAGAVGDVLKDELARLEARLEKLEAAPTKTLADAFQGPFKAGTQYRRGALVVHRGGLWIALSDTRAGPPGADWQLCVRAGRDAR